MVGLSDSIFFGSLFIVDSVFLPRPRLDQKPKDQIRLEA
jgi:hypothetical protein